MKFAYWLVAVAACGNNPATVDAAMRDAPKHDATLDAAAANAVHGNLGGAPFVVLDAVSNVVTADGFDFPDMSTDVTLTTYANDCSLQASQTGTPNGRLLILDLGITDGSGGSAAASMTGVYTVFSGTPAASSKLVEAYFEADDAGCHKSSFEFASSGTVTLTSATTPVTGTFDITFPASEHITGSFAAPTCASLDPNSTPLNGC